MQSPGLPFVPPVLFGQCGPASAPCSPRQFGSQWVAISDGSRLYSGSHWLFGLHRATDEVLRMCCARTSNTKRGTACTASCVAVYRLGTSAARLDAAVQGITPPAATVLEHMAFDGLTLSPDKVRFV